MSFAFGVPFILLFFLLLVFWFQTLVLIDFLTEFRQPLQVQSHLEMPRILVQLGHIQHTENLAPHIDPKWSPTWSLRRYQAISPLRARDGRYVCQISRAYRMHSRAKVISHGGTQILVSGHTHVGRPNSNKSFQLPPKIKRPNLHIVRYTCQYDQYQSHR